MSETTASGGPTRRRLRPQGEGSVFTVAEDSARYTGAARALALGNALFAPWANRGMADELEKIGMDASPRAAGSWYERSEAFNRSDRYLRDVDLPPEIADALRPITTGPQLDYLWSEVKSSRDPSVAIAFLRAMMASRDDLYVSAGASALHLRRKPQGEWRTSTLLVSVLLDRLAQSEDNDVAAIARATLGAPLRAAETPVVRREIDRRQAQAENNHVSLMVHGTAAYAGSWWRRGGDFHEYISRNLDAGLYAGDNPFSWSGAYKGRHRRVAAERLAGWAEEHGGHLGRVFAHSYGGVIAQLATTYGLSCDTLVLLSVPVEAVETEWRHIGRAVSLRIHMDLVLLAARRWRPFTSNVEEHYIDSWFTSHADSHTPDVWSADSWINQLSL